ncbi:MAG: undecaprenyl-diphosphatase UppP, partial [Patescibacteria group bacterium]
MIDFLYSVVLGAVQGLTEFWPISSSGHLLIAHDVLQFGFVDNLTFDVALHLGTLLALILFFWRDVAKLIVAFFRSIANWNVRNDFDQRLSWYIVVASIPAGIGGFLLDSWAAEQIRNLWVIASLLIGVGALLLLAERLFAKVKDIEQVTLGTAVLIGFAQVLALVPGVSRSGITMVAGMSRGLKRAAAARFTFLLSIPIIFGAGMKKLYDATQEGLTGHEWQVMLVGAVTAAAVGYLAIRFLLRYLENHSLNIFAYYRFVLGAAVIMYL